MSHRVRKHFVTGGLSFIFGLFILASLSGCKKDGEGPEACQGMSASIIPAMKNMPIGPNGASIPGQTELPFNIQTNGGTPPFQITKVTGFLKAFLNGEGSALQIKGTVANPTTDQPTTLGATVVDSNGCTVQAMKAVKVTPASGLFGANGLGLNGSGKQGPFGMELVPVDPSKPASPTNPANSAQPGNQPKAPAPPVPATDITNPAAPAPDLASQHTNG